MAMAAYSTFVNRNSARVTDYYSIFALFFCKNTDDRI